MAAKRARKSFKVTVIRKKVNAIKRGLIALKKLKSTSGMRKKATKIKKTADVLYRSLCPASCGSGKSCKCRKTCTCGCKRRKKKSTKRKSKKSSCSCK